jgi:hypothetical protein
MKITELNQAVDEVAMNPTAYAQSIEQGQSQGVLVGFEFEVCVPAAVFNPATTAEPEAKTHEMVDGLLYSSGNIADIDPSIEHYREFDSWFTAKPGKSRYPTFTAATKELLEKRIEQAKDLFYKIPEDIRLRFIRRAKSRADRYFRDDELMKPLKFAQILANEIRYEGWVKTAPYANILDKMSNIAFDTEDVLKKMFNTSPDKILRKMSEYFDYDPEEVYNQYGLDDYVHDEEEYEDYPGYTKASKTIAPVLKSTMGSKVEIFRERHDKTKKLDRWYIEPDGSLSPNEREDACVEIVGPPEAPNRALDSLKKFFGMAQQMKFYTNESTGLHINVSIPEDVDVLKLAVFTGDQYVLQQYGRLENNYSRSVTRDISKRDNQRQLARALPQTQSGRGKNVFGNEKISSELKLEFIQKIAKDISNSHVASISSENKKYISFRHTGGDYLTDYQGIVNVVGRFVRAMVIAADPTAYRNEYLAAVAKLAAPAVSAQSPSAEKDIARIQQEGLAQAVVYLLRDRPNISFKKVLTQSGMVWTAPLSVAGPIQPGSEEAKQAFMGSAPGFRFTGTGADGDRFKDHPVSEFAKVVVKSNNLQASDYYKQQASRGRLSTSNGYYVVKTEIMPATDPHVQQVILQMRKDRFKK